MVGSTLVELRERIEALAADGGRYVLVCARTGEGPVPADGLGFPTREQAAEAAVAVERYRAALRRYDPRLPYYDVVVHERYRDDGVRAISHPCADGARDDDWSLTEPVLAGRRAEPAVRNRVAFCHDVAAATFEALSAADHRGVESAIMEEYFALAESRSDPDDLCLCLLECMAAEMATGLAPGEEIAVLADAAARLGPVAAEGDPIDGAFTRLASLGLLGAFRVSPWSLTAEGTRAVDVAVEEYALAARDERLPVLPVVLDLYRHRLDSLASVRASAAESGWRIRIELGPERGGQSVACPPIGEGA